MAKDGPAGFLMLLHCSPSASLWLMGKTGVPRTRWQMDVLERCDQVASAAQGGGQYLLGRLFKRHQDLLGGKLVKLRCGHLDATPPAESRPTKLA